MIALAVVAALLVALVAWREHEHGRVVQQLLMRHGEERSELLTRIQHPEVIPIRPDYDVNAVVPEDEGEMALVGQIIPGEFE